MMIALDCPVQEPYRITFSETVTTIYREHIGALVDNIKSQNYAAHSVAQLYKEMAEVPLTTLLNEKSLPKVLYIYREESVKCTFDNAYIYCPKEKDVRQRLLLWKKLVACVETRRREMRSNHLPGIWFPETVRADNAQRFIKRNGHITLDDEQCAWMVADTVAAFLPYAFVEQYDLQLFSLFLLSQKVC